jgi:hypothetical protein
MPTISMCSASHPSFEPRALASRSAMHFFDRRALPPYPEPTLQMVLSCGKWQMNRRPSFRSDFECRPRVKSSDEPRWSSATCPIRVISPMLRAT